MKLKSYERVWDKYFRRRHKDFIRKNPHRTVPTVTQFLKKHGVKKILDLGCGSGRHIAYLAKRGFFVVGIDTSPAALRLANNWLKKEKISNYALVLGSMFKLPFQNEEFDAVLSTAAIDNFTMAEVKKAVQEAKRVLKKGGFFFANFDSTEHESFLRWKELGWKKLGPYTFVHPRRSLQSYFTEKMLRQLLAGFKIIKFEKIIWNRRLDKTFVRRHKRVRSVKWEVLAKKV